MSESFKKQFRGYKKADVDAAISKYEEQIEMQQQIIDKMKQEINALNIENDELTHKLDIRDKTNEEIARLALKEASQLIEKAKRNANMILKESMEYVKGLQGDIDEFKTEAINFRRNVVKMQEEMLETIDKSEIFSLIEEDNKNR